MALPSTAFKPGQSGNPGGRPKRAFPRVDMTLFQLGRNPVEEILALMPDLKPETQAKMWVELLAYCQPRPVAIIENDDPTASMTTEDLAKIAREKFPHLLGKL